MGFSCQKNNFSERIANFSFVKVPFQLEPRLFSWKVTFSASIFQRILFLLTYSVLLLLIAGLIHRLKLLTFCLPFVLKAGSLFAVLTSLPSVYCLCWKLVAYSRSWTANLLSTVCAESWKLIRGIHWKLTCCRLFVLKVGSLFGVLNCKPSVYRLSVCSESWKLIRGTEQLTFCLLFVLKADSVHRTSTGKDNNIKQRCITKICNSFKKKYLIFGS